jgi:ribosomal protein S18 acetylase RimI-like enzyme
VPEYLLARLDQDEQTPDFNCGDEDLNNYFRAGRHSSESALTVKTYALKESNGAVVALVCFANDRIDYTDDLSGPAVKIVAFGVSVAYQRRGIGGHLLQLFQGFFVIKNKTGCRYMTTDALLSSVNFYKSRCGFTGLGVVNVTESMFFDLLATKLAIERDPEILASVEEMVNDIILHGETQWTG